MRTTIFLFIFCIPAVSFAQDAKKKLTYDDHILPVLKERCLNCHNAGTQKGGLDLSSYIRLMEGGSSGEVVKAGEPDASRLYTLTAHKEEPVMPYPRGTAKIPDAQINLIKDWIAQGALENSGSKPAPMKPKADVSLKSITRGRPQGAPPMPVATLRKDPLVTSPRANAVVALAAGPWAPLVAVGGQKQVLLYHADTLELLAVLPFSPGTPHVLKFSRNGSLLLAGGGRGGSSGKVVVWNIATGEQILEVGNEPDIVLAADISADQTLIALGGPNKMIRIYSTKDGQLVREIKKHTDWLYAIEFSPDGVLLATADRNGGLFVWEAFTGREFYNLRGHTAAITDLSWRDDSNALASCSEDGSIRLWEMNNGSNYKTWGAHGGGSQSVGFTHDGRLVSVGRDRVPKLWDGNGAAQRAFEATADVSTRVAVSHDQTRLFAGDWTGVVRVYSVADGKLLGSISTNPPTLAQQIEMRTQEVQAKQSVFDQAANAATAAKAALDKAVAELVAQQKLATDTAAAAKAAADAVAPLQGMLDQANAALALHRNQVAARTVRVQVFAEAAAKLKAAADQAKTNAELTTFAVQAQQQADQAAGDLEAARKAAGESDAKVNDLTAKLTAAKKQMTDTAAAAKAAADAVAPKSAAVPPLTEAFNAAKAKADQAAAELNAAKQILERLKATAPKAP